MDVHPIKFSRLIVHTLALSVPCSVVGFLLVMTWGRNAEAGQSNLALTIAGIVGYVLTLPTMLTGYALEGATLGHSIETALTFVAQFAGYFGLVFVLHLRQRMVTLKRE